MDLNSDPDLEVLCHISFSFINMREIIEKSDIDKERAIKSIIINLQIILIYLGIDAKQFCDLFNFCIEDISSIDEPINNKEFFKDFTRLTMICEK